MTKTTLIVDQLFVGAYIELPLKWDEHPFLRSRFLIKNSHQIEVMQTMGLKSVYFYPHKSKAAPASVHADSSSAEVEASAPQEQQVLDNAWQQKKKQTEEFKIRKKEIQNANRQYKQTVDKIKDINSKMNLNPVQAIHESGEVIQTIVDSLQQNNNNLIHLMNSNEADDSMYYHQINVSVLALLIGQAVSLSREEMQIVGLAALLHDIGKVKVPAKILRKTEPLTGPEEALFQLHTQYGSDIVGLCPDMNSRVRLIIEQHHELSDGSGYPNQLKGSEIDLLSRIVIIANYYDDLCNQVDHTQSMTPHEALSLMFAKLANKFDKSLLQVMVKLLGIYPPGTVVQLSDDSTGLVLTLNQAELLRPSVVIYDPEVPKDQAVIVDLNKEKDITIKRSIRPAKLATEVHAYLNPRERVSYFFMLKSDDKKL